MKDAINDIEKQKIESFLLGHFEPEKQKAVLAEIESKPQLLAEMEAQKKLINEIESHGRAQFKSELKEIHAEQHAQKNTKELSKSSNGLKKIILSVFLLTLLGLAFLFLFQSTHKKESSADLYAAYFEPYELSSQRNGNKANKAFESLYSQKKYKDLIEKFDAEFNGLSELNSRQLLALGIAYMETADAENAETRFSLLILKNDFNYIDQARWYLSLNYLKTDEIEKSKALLHQLKSDIHSDHHKDAVALLEELNQ